MKSTVWFGPRWHRFAGKVAGDFGCWKVKERIAIPPFHPHRVRAQTVLIHKDGDYSVAARARPFHVYQRSPENLTRDFPAGDRLFAWWSGCGVHEDKASVMIYDFSDNPVTWFGSFLRQDCWRVVRTKGIVQREVQEMLDLGSRLVASLS